MCVWGGGGGGATTGVNQMLKKYFAEINKIVFVAAVLRNRKHFVVQVYRYLIIRVSLG